MGEVRIAHEDLARPDNVKIGSERSFGFVFAAACSLVAAWMLFNSRLAFWPWIIAAAFFAVAATAIPVALRPLNVLWFKFGQLLHSVISPVILGVMFYAVVVPIGLLMRAMGRRPLGLTLHRNVESYWVWRRPPGPPPESFRNQF